MTFGSEVMPFKGTSMQIFNPIASTILKWMRFKVVSWMHNFQPCTAMIWDCLHQQLYGTGNQGMYFTKGSEII
jgi:hypothetical protein